MPYHEPDKGKADYYCKDSQSVQVGATAGGKFRQNFVPLQKISIVKNDAGD